MDYGIWHNPFLARRRAGIARELAKWIKKALL